MTDSQRVAILYNQPRDTAPAEERDVLVQVAAVHHALRSLGHDVVPLGCCLNLESVRQRLQQIRPDVVFNLVESLWGTDRLVLLVTLLLDALEMPYTGAGTEAAYQTVNKLLAKQRMHQAGLPTPDWLTATDAAPDAASSRPSEARRWIVKPVWEHASFGMTDDSVVHAAEAAGLLQQIEQRQQATRRAHFAEVFIEGREFNLSLLATEGPVPEVLPPAEIDFAAFPAGKPRIVGYQAKWDDRSSEYHQTPRVFDFDAADQRLLDQLRHLSRSCWRLFGLRGYARVDFRVDETGRPWILEINTNPCLSGDAGFAAALVQAGISYDEAIQRILHDAVAPSR